MSLIQKSKQAVSLAGIMLKNTKHINQTDIESDVAWATIAKEYRENQAGTWFEKAQVVLINMIIYHRKGAFILTRDDFAQACRTDKNWIDEIGFTPKNWPRFLFEASGIMKVVKKVKNPKSGRLVYIYEVIMPDLLALLNVNVAEQIANCETFILNDRSTEGTEQGTKVGNTEEEKKAERDKEKNVVSEENAASSPPNNTGSSFSSDTPIPNPSLAQQSSNLKDQIRKYPLATKLRFILRSKYAPEKYVSKFEDFLALVENGNQLSRDQINMTDDWCLKVFKLGDKDKQE